MNYNDKVKGFINFLTVQNLARFKAYGQNLKTQDENDEYLRVKSQVNES